MRRQLPSPVRPACRFGVSLALVMALNGIGAATCHADGSEQAAPPSAPAAASEPAASAAVTPPRKRAPLLREGSFLARSRGSVRRDDKRNEWLFVPSTRDASGIEREIVLLPNANLAEAKRTLELSPRELQFEATGELFIYQGRNYLLLSMMLPIAPPAASAATEKPSEAPTPAATKTPAQPNPVPKAPREDDAAIVDELERQLLERIQSVPKSPSPVAAEAATEKERTITPESRAAARLATAPAAERIQSRRGHLLRDGATGGWRFVFEGQLPDGEEPSMPVLPCLALERIEGLVRAAESQLPLTVSGVTTWFDGRTFLLPTSFRVARGGKGINP